MTNTDAALETLPKDYKIVGYGDVEEGDLLWDEADGWGPAAEGEVGRYVWSFKLVARERQKK